MQRGTPYPHELCEEGCADEQGAEEKGLLKEAVSRSEEREPQEIRRLTQLPALPHALRCAESQYNAGYGAPREVESSTHGA